MIIMSHNSVRVVIYDDVATAKRICGNARVGLFLATTWARYFSKYTPMQSGTMRDSVSIEPFKVTYNAPYSHYQWEGKLYVSPSTGSAWAKSGEIKVPVGKNLTYSKEQNPLATDHWHIPAEAAFKSTVARQVTEYIRRL